MPVSPLINTVTSLFATRGAVSSTRERDRAATDDAHANRCLEHALALGEPVPSCLGRALDREEQLLIVERLAEVVTLRALGERTHREALGPAT